MTNYNHQIIDMILDYGKKLIGTPYIYFTHSTLEIEDIMYITDKYDHTNINSIKTIGTNCAGLVNIFRKYLNLSVPGINEPEKYKFPGGTYAWYNYLRERKRLQPFNYKQSYPKGTLLLRNYSHINSQGHLAIIYEENNIGVLFSKLLHSYPEHWDIEDEKTGPGIIIENNVWRSHFSWEQNGFYTHICLPEDWLLKD